MFTILLSACQIEPKVDESPSDLKAKVNEFTPVELNSDLLNNLSDNQKQLLSYLIDAAALVDEIFWEQSFGDKESLPRPAGPGRKPR